MKILITGANGLLGKKLCYILSKKNKVLATDKNITDNKDISYLDITQQKIVSDFIHQNMPDIVIHTAALTDTNYCEIHQREAKKVNIEGTKNIVLSCKKYNIKLIYLSSDYVFSGNNDSYRENSQPNPINYYGKTKLICEKLIKKMLTNYLIIRPGILYGYNDEKDKETFPHFVIKSLQNNQFFKADNTIIKYPTLIDDVSLSIEKLITLEATGIYHCASQKGLTRYQWACLVAESYHLPTNKIQVTKQCPPSSKPINVLLLTKKIKHLGINFVEPVEGTEIIKKQQGCMFKLIYSLRPDKLLLNKNASLFRIELGRRLAKESPVKADRIMPIPDSGIFGAIGYSEESKIPFYFGIIRDYKTDKTLYESEIIKRSKMINNKLIILPKLIKDQRIVLIDEAILSGLTLTNIIRKLKKAGPKEIHIRIFSPIMLNNCQNRILNTSIDFIAKRFDQSDLSLKQRILAIEQGLKNYFQVQSFHYLSLSAFLSSLSPKEVNESCFDCFIH